MTRHPPQSLPAAGTDTFASLLRTHPEKAYDYLEFRRLVAGVAAALAAERGNPEEIAHLRQCLEAMEAAHATDSHEDEAAADAAFHLAIYEAAHNEMMLHIMRPIFEMLRQGVFYDRTDLYLRKGVRDGFLRQHQAIYHAIAAGNPEAARLAAEAHLASTEEALREAQKADARREVALRRQSGSDLVARGRRE